MVIMTGQSIRNGVELMLMRVSPVLWGDMAMVPSASVMVGITPSSLSLEEWAKMALS